VRDTELPTLRQFQIPVVLIICGTEELIGAIGEVAVSLQVLVSECSEEDAATTAAQMRPLVIILHEEIYQQDPIGFEALARDVRARVMRVARGHTEPLELEQRLTQLMAEAEAQRDSWSGELRKP
jgi:hypothetical protein